MGFLREIALYPATSPSSYVPYLERPVASTCQGFSWPVLDKLSSLSISFIRPSLYVLPPNLGLLFSSITLALRTPKSISQTVTPCQKFIVDHFKKSAHADCIRIYIQFCCVCAEGLCVRVCVCVCAEIEWFRATGVASTCANILYCHVDYAIDTHGQGFRV